jgi:hypothetical protein
MFLEWNEECGVQYNKLFPLMEGIQKFLKDREYGSSLSAVTALAICRPQDFKQRKRFKKSTKELEYDIILDYFLIKNAVANEKKTIIKNQIIDVTEETFSKYKFDDFNTQQFLIDFKQAVNTITW